MSEFRWERDGDKFRATAPVDGCPVWLKCWQLNILGLWHWSATVAVDVGEALTLEVGDSYESLAAAQGDAEACVPELLAAAKGLAKSRAERLKQESERC
jgi:hypothetical protein